jgi:hypothetical protein
MSSSPTHHELPEEELLVDHERLVFCLGMCLAGSMGSAW